MVSVLVVTVTGYAWASMQGLISGLTLTDVIGEGAGGPLPADGSRDILLVGLDSRTDAQGNPLPDKLLRRLRAGVAGGELNTDTLILVHIPNDGSKAVALSLPRDSFVDIPGYGEHKINSAYGRGKIVERRRLQDEAGITDEKELELRANQQGAKVLISTIETLTGRTIDNYASINLLGFYEITKALGGVDVCLNNAVQDQFSGANFPKGKQTISGAKALSFVRQRHGLPRGDLDRVVRQQVFMAGLARKVVSAGTLANPGKLNSLLDAVKKSVVLNQGWDVLSFAQQLSGLTGGQIQFRTIPVLDLNLTTPDGSAVQVDPAEIQAFIQGLSQSAKPGPGAPPSKDPANAKTTVDVMNTTGITGLAAGVSESLTARGFTAGNVDDAQPRETTVVRHTPGEEAAAQKVADALEGSPAIEADPSLAAGRVVVFLGADYPADGATNGGGGSQPQSSPLRRQPPSSPPLNDNKPITADGVTCVN